LFLSARLAPESWCTGLVLAEVILVYAIIETGGKQFKVSKGDILNVERLTGAEGDSVVFDRVLAVKKDDGEVQVGDPVVKGAQATGKIVTEFKTKKIIVFKYKSKVNERKKRGHRQIQTRVLIEDIIAGE
jgi:large subunit ribosomal protein L21